MCLAAVAEAAKLRNDAAAAEAVYNKAHARLRKAQRVADEAYDAWEHAGWLVHDADHVQEGCRREARRPRQHTHLSCASRPVVYAFTFVTDARLCPSSTTQPHTHQRRK